MFSKYSAYGNMDAASQPTMCPFGTYLESMDWPDFLKLDSLAIA